MAHARQPIRHRRLPRRERRRPRRRHQIDHAQRPVRTPHEIPRVQVGDQIRPRRHGVARSQKEQPRVVTIRPQKTRRNLDQARRQRARHIVALRQRLPERLLRHHDAFRRHRHHFGRHAAEGMHEQQFLQQPAVAAKSRLGPQRGFFTPPKTKLAADPPFFARQIKFINGAVRLRGKRPRLHAAADAPQPRVGLLQRIRRRLTFGLRQRCARKAKILQRSQRHQAAQVPDRRTEPRPLVARGLEQAYFVFGEEDEIAVRICAETAFGCRRADAIERRQSSLVIVLKIASRFGPREEAALDAGELAGEVVLHGSAMPRTSGAPAALATGFCPQVIRTGGMKIVQTKSSARSSPRQPQAGANAVGRATADSARHAPVFTATGARATSTLSTRRLSISTTSKRQPDQSK